MLGFLFVDEATSFDGRRDELLDDGRPRGRAGGVRRARRRWPTWRPRRSRRRCGQALVEGLGLKPRNAFGPVRVAVTGRRVSPPLFESLELLGRERSLGRLQRGPGVTAVGQTGAGTGRPGRSAATTGIQRGRPTPARWRPLVGHRR